MNLKLYSLFGADFFKEIMMIQGYSQYRNHTDMRKMVRMTRKKNDQSLGYTVIHQDVSRSGQKD